VGRPGVKRTDGCATFWKVEFETLKCFDIGHGDRVFDLIRSCGFSVFNVIPSLILDMVIECLI
jgi:hypothetical protein